MDNFSNTWSENRYIKLDCYLWFHFFVASLAYWFIFIKRKWSQGLMEYRETTLCGFSTLQHFNPSPSFPFFLGKDSSV